MNEKSLAEIVHTPSAYPLEILYIGESRSVTVESIDDIERDREFILLMIRSDE